MATYVVLTKFTDQGIRKAKDLPEESGSLQADGESAWGDGKGTILDAGTDMTLSRSSRHQMRFPLLPLT